MAHLIFLGAFYTVVVVVAATVIAAFLRSRRAVQAGSAGRIRWHSEFADLPPRDRVCRHVLTAELPSRECPHGFDCRECRTHAALVRNHPLAPAADPQDDLFGMSYPLDRFYHRGHTWAHLE